MPNKAKAKTARETEELITMICELVKAGEDSAAEARAAILAKRLEITLDEVNKILCERLEA